MSSTIVLRVLAVFAIIVAVASLDATTVAAAVDEQENNDDESSSSSRSVGYLRAAGDNNAATATKVVGAVSANNKNRILKPKEQNSKRLKTKNNKNKSSKSSKKNRPPPAPAPTPPAVTPPNLLGVDGPEDCLGGLNRCTYDVPCCEGYQCEVSFFGHICMYA